MVDGRDFRVGRLLIKPRSPVYGSSLTINDPLTHPATLSEPENWHPATPSPGELKKLSVCGFGMKLIILLIRA